MLYEVITQPDVDQELEPVHDLTHDSLGDLGARPGEPQGAA